MIDLKTPKFPFEIKWPIVVAFGTLNKNKSTQNSFIPAKYKEFTYPLTTLWWFWFSSVPGMGLAADPSTAAACFACKSAMKIFWSWGFQFSAYKD